MVIQRINKINKITRNDFGDIINYTTDYPTNYPNIFG